MRVWIPQGRATVKHALRLCSVCRRFEGGQHKVPTVCSFPKSRVTTASAFQRIGVDCLGPFLLKHDEERRVWICLFTWIITQAFRTSVRHDHCRVFVVF